MIGEREFARFKKQIAKLKRQKERSEGRIEQLRLTLKEEFNCKSVEEAQLKLRKLKRTQAKNEEKFQKDLKRFKEKYSRLLAEYGNVDQKGNRGTPV